MTIVILNTSTARRVQQSSKTNKHRPPTKRTNHPPARDAIHGGNYIMNRTLLITSAALAAAFMQPVYAKDEGRSGGGRSGGGGARFEGGASMRSAPRAEARVQTPRMETR